MKLKFSLILCCAIFSMFVCGRSNSNIKITSTDLPQTVSSETAISTETPKRMPTEKLTQTFKDVLNNKVKINQKAYKGSYDEETTYQPFYLNELIRKIGFQKNWKPSEFTILDMNGDKIPEVVIEIDVGSDCIYEVLHYYNGKMYGYYFVNRAMEALKADGTHVGSSGAMDNSIIKLSFSGNKLNEITLAYSESTDKVDKKGYSVINYVIANKPVSDTEFKSYWDKQDAKTDTTWHKFNAKNIEKYLKVK